MKLISEELLEPVARYFRFTAGVQHLDKNRQLTLVDLGCGPQLRFYHFLAKAGVQVKKYIGVDPLIEPAVVSRFTNQPSISIITRALRRKIEQESATVDYVVAFAFFEHINNPKEILGEAYRLLKPGGKIILTVPSPKAKRVLEFLSFKLGIISRREIEEHKRYFNQEQLMKLLPKGVIQSATFHRYFEFGLNNLFVITKPSR